MKLCIFTSREGHKIAVNPEKVVLISKDGSLTRIFADGNIIDVKEDINTAIEKVIGGKHE